jgi:hypothetical protein
VRALPYPAGVGIVDECLIKEWGEYAIYPMMEQAVAHARLVDITRFGIADFEVTIRRVPICFALQCKVQSKNIIHQTILKLLYISLPALASHKLLPGEKQIFNRDDILVGMRELEPLMSPPPTEFAPRG